MAHLLHLLSTEERRLAKGEGLQVDPRQGFHLDGQGESLVEGGAHRDLTVLGHQAGQPSLEGLNHTVGELLGSKGGVGGTADVDDIRCAPYATFGTQELSDGVAVSYTHLRAHETLR